jgi:hypothetical protein
MAWTYEVHPFVQAGRSTFYVYRMSLCVGSWKEIYISPSLLDLFFTLQHCRRVLNFGMQNRHSVTFFHGPTAPLGQGHLIIEASRSHSGTPHSVGLLLTRDQPVTQTSNSQHTTFTTNRHPSSRWDSNWQTHQKSGHRVRHRFVALQPPPTAIKA